MDQSEKRTSPKKTSKASHACLSCKERKTKCTGMPGPCKACTKSDKYCHFDLKLDARKRRNALELSALHLRQQSILEGLLRSIKFNDYDMVQSFVEAIRNDDSAPNVAKTLQNNIEAVHEQGEFTKQDINDTDLITLLMKCLSYPPTTRSRTSSTTSTTLSDRLEQPSRSSCASPSTPPASTGDLDLSFDNLSHFQDQSSNSDAGQRTTELADPFTDCELTSTSNTSTSLKTPVYSPDSDTSASFPIIFTPQIANFETRMALNEDTSQDWCLSESKALQFDGIEESWSFMEGLHHSSSHSPLRTSTLPSIYPGDPINDIVLAFRDKARDLLESGIALRSVMGFGLTDVELLFRTRLPDEAWNVPGWACEMMWDSQNYDFHVRLAEVFMRVRFMRWLILPNEQTWSGIPGILRPTTAQMRFPHSVAIDFLPIPTVRNSLVRVLKDWHTPLSSSGYSCNWDEGLGPAVVTDPSTGRRQLSAQFERHICTYQNWSARECILETWPELSGEMTLDKTV